VGLTSSGIGGTFYTHGSLVVSVTAVYVYAFVIYFVCSCVSVCVCVCVSFRGQNRNPLNGKRIGKSQSAIVVHVCHSNVRILRQVVCRL